MASLILLMATSAVFFAAMATALADRDNLPSEELAALCGAAGLLTGIIVGIVVGVGRTRRRRGTVLGLFVGGSVGLATGLLVAAPKGMLALLVGSPLVIIYGLVVRYYSRTMPDDQAR